MKIYNILFAAILCCMTVSLGSCQLDERLNDLKSSYRGAFIDKETGDTIATEYFASKIKLLDLKYGDRAIPMEYDAKPEGGYENTHLFPSDYKMWAVGPFYKIDTLYTNFENGSQKVDLMALPNVRLEIKSVEVKYGIAAEITYAYELINPEATSCNIGLVYGTSNYPGFKTAMEENVPTATVKKRIVNGITQKKGTFTETLYLRPNQKYYLRALGKSDNAGDYWNYSKLRVIQTGDIDISSLPIKASVGVSSATSAILQWAFPPLVDEIRVSYTDKDGVKVNDSFSPNGYSYVANLPHNTDNPIKVILVAGKVESPEQTITIRTKSVDEKYVPAASDRPATVPFYNDASFKMSLSWRWAEILGPSKDPSWITSPIRYEFFDWWNTWLMNNSNMPSCQDIEGFTELTVYGNVRTLVDILAFVNLNTLNIKQGEAFNPGTSIDTNVDLTVLKKLKKLKKVVLGKGVSLTKAQFQNAGLAHIEIINQ